jgi:hypothetical protein
MSLRLNFFWFTYVELDVSVDDSDTLTKRVLKISCKTYISRRRNHPFLRNSPAPLILNNYFIFMPVTEYLGTGGKGGQSFDSANVATFRVKAEARGPSGSEIILSC